VKVVLVVALLAVAIYVVVRLVDRRGLTSPAPPPPPRPQGPDDDPDFLRGLDRHPDDDR
jgi:hypothetical protein